MAKNPAFKKEKFKKGFKVVLNYLALYKKDLLAIAIFSTLSSVATGIVPYITGRFFDALLNPSKIFVGSDLEIPLFLFLLATWCLVRLLGDIIDWRNDIKISKIEEAIFPAYISNAYATFLEMPLSFHKNYKMGEIMEKINRAANWITRIIGNVIIGLVPLALTLITALIITFSVQPVLASFLLAGVVVYIAVLLRIISPAAELQIKGNKAYSKAFGDAYDVVFNVQAVKQAVAENYERRNTFRNFRIKAVNIWRKIAGIWNGVGFYQRLIMTITQFVIFGFSIFYIYKGTMTVGQLIMFSSYIGMFFAPFARLGHNWQDIQNGLLALGRAEKILTLPKEIYSPVKAPILSDIKGRVVFENVVFKYHRKHGDILDGISFKAEPGEIVALVGGSGVGKTTIIDLVSGYYFPQKGKILVDGHNVKNLDLKFLRSKIAVVPQEVVLFNDTIKKNIAYGIFSATEKQIKEAAEKSYASEFIESFPKKYNQVVGERGIKLSVGQKQRVSIARAILRNPRILILDEPTSALDAKSEKFIQESLEKLMKGKTTFIIAHRLSTVRKADKILVIQDGKIVEQGKHEELIQIPNGVYREFYELQIGLL